MAYGWSLYAVLGRGDSYVEVGTALVAFLLVGRWIEARGTRRAGAALRALVELGARDAASVVSAVAKLGILIRGPQVLESTPAGVTGTRSEVRPQPLAGRAPG